MINDVSQAALLTSGASGRAHALFRSFLVMLLSAAAAAVMSPFRRREATVAAGGEKERESGRGVVRVPANVVRVPVSVPWERAAAVMDQEAAARRAVAVKRVNQGSDSGGVRAFSLLGTDRGQIIFTQSWSPVAVHGSIRGLVIILHGLNEHGDRYDGFAKELTANRYKVYAMDWIGHGGSDGMHAYVHSLDDAVLDMKKFISKVVTENPGLPCFCFGHSTGAAIILKSVLDPKIEAYVAGVVLTSPLVGVQQPHSVLAVLAPILSFLLPRYQLSAANKQGILVSRDPEAILAKYSDPLVYTGSIRIRTGYEILRITTFLQQNLARLTVPFLVLHGTADSITDPKASQKLYDEASSTDKTIRLIEGLYHDLLFELERKMIIEEIIDWFNSRT